MSDARFENRWKEFKVVFAQLRGAKLLLSVNGGAPLDAPGLGYAVDSLLFVNLVTLLDEAIKTQMSVEDYRACGTLQNRLRWLNRDNMLVDFEALTTIRRRHEGDMPGTGAMDVAAAYEAVERQLAAWDLVDAGRRYSLRQTIAYCEVLKFPGDEAEYLSSPRVVKPKRENEALAVFLDVVDGERVVSYSIQRMSDDEAKAIDPARARLASYARALEGRQLDAHQYMSLAAYAANAGGAEQATIDEAGRRVGQIEEEIGFLEAMKTEVQGDNADALADIRKRFNAHLAVVKGAAAALSALPILPPATGKAADQV